MRKEKASKILQVSREAGWEGEGGQVGKHGQGRVMGRDGYVLIVLIVLCCAM